MLSVEKGLPAALHDMLNRLKQVYTRDEILTQCRPVFEKEYMLSRLRKRGLPDGGLLELDPREPADDGSAVRARRVLRVPREQRGRLAAEARSRNLHDGDRANGRRARRDDHRRRLAARRRSGAPIGRARLPGVGVRRRRLLPRSRGHRSRRAPRAADAGAAGTAVAA